MGIPAVANLTTALDNASSIAQGKEPARSPSAMGAQKAVTTATEVQTKFTSEAGAAVLLLLRYDRKHV